MAEFKLGFADYARAHPEIGTPLEDEHPLDPSNFQAQETSEGVLLYSKHTNRVLFVPKAV